MTCTCCGQPLEGPGAFVRTLTDHRVFGNVFVQPPVFRKIFGPFCEDCLREIEEVIKKRSVYASDRQYLGE